MASFVLENVDLLSYIGKFLELSDLLRARAVSRKWRMSFTMDSLYIKFGANR